MNKPKNELVTKISEESKNNNKLKDSLRELISTIEIIINKAFCSLLINNKDCSSLSLAQISSFIDKLDSIYLKTIYSSSLENRLFMLIKIIEDKQEDKRKNIISLKAKNEAIMKKMPKVNEKIIKLKETLKSLEYCISSYISDIDYKIMCPFNPVYFEPNSEYCGLFNLIKKYQGIIKTKRLEYEEKVNVFNNIITKKKYKLMYIKPKIFLDNDVITNTFQISQLDLNEGVEKISNYSSSYSSNQTNELDLDYLYFTDNIYKYVKNRTLSVSLTKTKNGVINKSKTSKYVKDFVTYDKPRSKSLDYQEQNAGNKLKLLQNYLLSTKTLVGEKSINVEEQSESPKEKLIKKLTQRNTSLNLKIRKAKERLVALQNIIKEKKSIFYNLVSRIDANI